MDDVDVDVDNDDDGDGDGDDDDNDDDDDGDDDVYDDEATHHTKEASVVEGDSSDCQ